MSSYSVIEGDTMRVCITVMCGQLLQDELVILSIRDGTERGHCMNILLHTMNENFIVLILEYM